MCFGLRLGNFSLMLLIITDSFYSKNIINYNFYLKHVGRKENGGVQAEIWHYLNYKGHFYLCVLVRQAETNDIRLLYAHVQFCKFQVVSQSCNMLQLCVKLCSSVFPVCRYVLNIISVQILNKWYQSYASLLASRLSFWNQYEFGMDKPCIYRGPDRSAVDRFSYPRPNGFTCESDPVWSCTVPAWYHVHVSPSQLRETRARVDLISTEKNQLISCFKLFQLSSYVCCC